MSEPSPAVERPRPSRRTLVLILVPIIAGVITAQIGNAIHPVLLQNNPLALIAMEPRNRWLLLVANKGVEFWPFLVIASLRRLATDPFFFILGRLYGDGAVAWVERRFDNNSGLVRRFERLFRRAAPAMVFISPGPLVCVLAGATGMRPRTFWICNITGTLLIVALLFQLAEYLEGPLTVVNDFYSRNFRWLLVVSILLTLVWVLSQRKQGRGEIGTVSEIEEQLESGGDDRP